MILRNYVKRKMKEEDLTIGDIAAEIGMQRLATLYNLMKIPPIGEHGAVPTVKYTEMIMEWSNYKVMPNDYYKRRKK